MDYQKPTISIGSNYNNGATPRCGVGAVAAIAVAAGIWNVAGIYSYAGVAVAAVLAGVSFLVVGTGCWPD
ncbi:hypothetical protein [Clostridium perfringens]|uniref:hypothetical protein n=1 Tax=Clostridium perfringens TaxID=1502 RepID=UPI000D71BF2A|nr:hypothetical protein [Clostridium perfringens]PWX46961.1 hypothetical protein CYK61_14100 [Clostridium perfringens]HAT4117243.1 hypothetical protein [Clostridium perfringens]HBC2031676.1 hypothetical protein [Clostridium perfringens]HBC2035035.1 hypothetical protein [Clostridium perfringens]HBC2058198.1 hypothetical protein [Clostridium perfringens]